MIYAIPNDGERVANHFVKAPYIAIYSDLDGMLQNITNMAAVPQSGCKAKSHLIQSLQDYNVDAVLVRNIGERALGKLLNSGKQVFRLSTRSLLEEVLRVERTLLTDASHGRSSVNHKKKGRCGSCDCGSKQSKPSRIILSKYVSTSFDAKTSPTIMKLRASFYKVD